MRALIVLLSAVLFLSACGAAPGVAGRGDFAPGRVTDLSREPLFSAYFERAMAEKAGRYGEGKRPIDVAIGRVEASPSSYDLRNNPTEYTVEVSASYVVKGEGGETPPRTVKVRSRWRSLGDANAYRNAKEEAMKVAAFELADKIFLDALLKTPAGESGK